MAASLVLGLAAGAQAGSDALLPGEYITQGGTGILTISTSEGRTIFSIEVLSPTGHSCGLDGEIRGLQARLEMEGEDEPCEVTFLPKADQIEVASSGPGCHRYFCGARASFESEYFRPAPGCGTRERSAERDRFKELYDAKSYAQAAAGLEPLLSRCAKTLGFVEEGRIRNDLAVTLFHLGRRADCRKTLEPLMEHAARTEEELRRSVAPGDYEDFLPVARAASFNARLCAPVTRVTFKTRTFERKDLGTVSFSYPVIQAAPSEALQVALTQAIDQFIVGEEGQAATPEAAADAFLAEYRRALQRFPQEAGYPWNLSRTAKIIYQDAKVVSLRLDEWAFTGNPRGDSSVR
jgi:hypothetical protein